MFGFNFYSYLQNYGLCNEDDSKNFETLVLEAKSKRKMDNTELLLDVIPRSILGYDFSLEKVYNCYNILFDYLIVLNLEFRNLYIDKFVLIGRGICPKDNLWSGKYSSEV